MKWTSAPHTSKNGRKTRSQRPEKAKRTQRASTLRSAEFTPQQRPVLQRLPSCLIAVLIPLFLKRDHAYFSASLDRGGRDFPTVLEGSSSPLVPGLIPANHA